ncbi:MAG TPA: septum formation initiator family protein [Polyangiaceae bacterium]|nr:septum formation initiator family protein [Polyangiaceae bacterium]
MDLRSSLPRALPVGILALAVFSVPVMVLRPEGLPRMRALEKELTSVQGENRALRHDIGDLKTEVRHLRDDPAAVEHIARNELGMVRKSEIVFQFPKAPREP